MKLKYYILDYKKTNSKVPNEFISETTIFAVKISNNAVHLIIECTSYLATVQRVDIYVITTLTSRFLIYLLRREVDRIFGRKFINLCEIN